jgi:cell division protein ZapA
MSNDVEEIINVTILDRVYKIKCKQGEASDLQSSAKYVEEQMRKVRQSGLVTNTDRVAVVTALNLSHELLKLKQEKTQSSQLMNQRIQNLFDRVKNSVVAEEEVTA